MLYIIDLKKQIFGIFDLEAGRINCVWYIGCGLNLLHRLENSYPQLLHRLIDPIFDIFRNMCRRVVKNALVNKLLFIIPLFILLNLPCQADQTPNGISTGTITGKVILAGTTDYSNVKIQAVHTNLLGTKPDINITYTDINGNYTLNLTTGTCRITFKKPNYITETTILTIVSVFRYNYRINPTTIS